MVKNMKKQKKKVLKDELDEMFDIFTDEELEELDKFLDEAIAESDEKIKQRDPAYYEELANKLILSEDGKSVVHKDMTCNISQKKN